MAQVKTVATGSGGVREVRGGQGIPGGHTLRPRVPEGVGRRWVQTATSLVGLALLLLGASGTTAWTTEPAAATAPLVLTDARGQEVRLPGPPQRIAVAGRASFMILDALYLFPTAGSRIVAVGQDSRRMESFLRVIDPGYASKTALGREAGAEPIAAARPEVVLMKSDSAGTLGRTLETLGIPVVCMDFETPEQFYRDLAILGRLLGQEGRAGELAGLFRARHERVEKALAGLSETDKPRVLVIYYSTRDGGVAFNVPPIAWIQTLLVEMAGGRPVWKDMELGRGWTKVGFEQIAAWDPDRIIVVSYFTPTDQALTALRADPRWQALRAVREGTFWAFPGDHISWDQPDPRWILGLAWLARKLHPGRFPGLDLAAEAAGFFRTFYGADDQTVQRLILPTLHGDL